MFNKILSRFLQIWIWVSKQLRILRWFGICWEKCKNLANKKVKGKRSVQNWTFYSSVLLTCTSFWQITCSRYTFFKFFPGFEISIKFCVFLYSYVKKEIKIFGVMEYIYEYFLEIVECKFARNGLNNWKTFLTNILKNIIWHLFAGESHQVVKITVTYPAYFIQFMLYIISVFLLCYYRVSDCMPG